LKKYRLYWHQGQKRSGKNWQIVFLKIHIDKMLDG